MFYSLWWQLLLSLSLFRATAPVSQCSVQFSVPWQKTQSKMKLQRELFFPYSCLAKRSCVHCCLANNHLTLASLQINFCHAYAEPLCHDMRIKCSVAFPLVNDPALPEKQTTDISRRHHWFPREMTSEKREQKFHTDDVSLPRSG